MPKSSQAAKTKQKKTGGNRYISCEIAPSERKECGQNFEGSEKKTQGKNNIGRFAAGNTYASDERENTGFRTSDAGNPDIERSISVHNKK